SRVAKNYQRFLSVVDDIKNLLPAGSAMDAREAVELVSLFADTWLSLTAYDKDVDIGKSATKKSVVLSAEKLMSSLTELKQELVEKGMATELFGLEREMGNVAGIVGNIMQSFAGQELYGTVEEKAAHLLYFMVKNHPFVDGNKRNGAYAFVWFLRQAKILDVNRFSPVALTAVTILVAESNPQHKEKTIKLILNLISKK
ncbi:MAG: Fic family protein, partial [Patescibacteria group bacterium]